jgi:hypothetical protein
MNAISTRWHQHAVGVKRAGAWIGVAMLLASMILGSLPELEVDHIWIELLSWAGCGLGGAVLVPEATSGLMRFSAGGGGVILVLVAREMVNRWPESSVVGFIATGMVGIAGLLKGGALVRKPDVARASTLPPEPDTDPGFKRPSKSPPPLPKA